MSPLRFIIRCMMHHLKDKPKSVEHRARIAASRRVSFQDDPELWEAEYKLALQNIKGRERIKKRNIKQSA